jgi:cytochrome c-type biogenesis protein CcmE
VSPANKKRLIALGAVLVAASALAFISLGGIEDNLVYYWDARELIDHGAKAYGTTVRLGGVVQRGSKQWDDKTLNLDFDVGIAPEAGQPSVHVHSVGQPPQMFQEGIGVVVEGRYDGQTFTADRLLVKHSNEYRPPATGEKPSEIYGTLLDK